MQALDFRVTAILLLSTLLLTNHSASAATARGSGALAVAALVGAHAPGLIRHDKRTLEQLLDGHASVPFPANRKISIEAAAIDCTAGNVDITAHSCKLTFGAETVHITGRKAHELYATLVEVGIPSEGAAGTLHETVSHLVCTINPHEIAQKAGGGADCTFDTLGRLPRSENR
jgi:hypothetical protein